MDWYLILRWLHILGATVLLGTGAGIAFFMVMAHRSKNPYLIAHTASIVVIADWVFTASAVIAQPITGLLLAMHVGWSLKEPWLIISILLYIITGAFWLPVVWIQHKLRDLARTAVSKNTELPARYFKLFKVWFWSGFPAFFSVLAIIWLMIAKPTF